MVGGSGASQPAPPCSPDEWHLLAIAVPFAEIWASWGFYAGHAHALSCEHGAHVPASMFCMVGICMLVRWLVHLRCWGFTSVAGVMRPGAVDLSSGLPVVGWRMGATDRSCA